MRIHRTILATAMTVAAAGAVLTGVSAANAAAHPVSKFNVAVGNTYTKGTITWYGRVVTVKGVEKSVDDFSCRGTTAYTLNSRNHQLAARKAKYNACGGTQTFNFNVPANVRGGAAVVRVCLSGEDPFGGWHKLLKCQRYGR